MNKAVDELFRLIKTEDGFTKFIEALRGTSRTSIVIINPKDFPEGEQEFWSEVLNLIADRNSSIANVFSKISSTYAEKKKRTPAFMRVAVGLLGMDYVFTLTETGNETHGFAHFPPDRTGKGAESRTGEGAESRTGEGAGR